MYSAPAWTVTVSSPISRIRSILRVTTTVPSSATPQAVVEWLEPTARTGAGYRCVSFTIATICSTEVTSTTSRGDEVMLPNQFVPYRAFLSGFRRARHVRLAPMRGGHRLDF